MIDNQEPVRLRIGNFNLEFGGWSGKTRFHDHTKLIRTLKEAPPPHILTLTECTNYDIFHYQPLWEAVGLLDELWEGKDFYRPFLSPKTSSNHPPGLFVSSRYVRPLSWHVNDRGLLQNYLEADIAGMRVFINGMHWTTGRGTAWFEQQSVVTGQAARYPTLLVGDFNGTSSVPGDLVFDDWQARCSKVGTPWKRRKEGVKRDGEWMINTDPFDELLADGFWDVGTEANDFTVTVNENVDNGLGIRIDRIVCSDLLPARLVPGSYQVIVPPGGETTSDHHYVTCELEFHPSFARRSE